MSLISKLSKFIGSIALTMSIISCNSRESELESYLFRKSEIPKGFKLARYSDLTDDDFYECDKHNEKRPAKSEWKNPVYLDREEIREKFKNERRGIEAATHAYYTRTNKEEKRLVSGITLTVIKYESKEESYIVRPESKVIEARLDFPLEPRTSLFSSKTLQLPRTKKMYDDMVHIRAGIVSKASRYEIEKYSSEENKAISKSLQMLLKRIDPNGYDKLEEK